MYKPRNRYTTCYDQMMTECYQNNVGNEYYCYDIYWEVEETCMTDSALMIVDAILGQVLEETKARV